MRNQVLNQFEHPWLMVMGMFLFIAVFIFVMMTVNGKRKKKEFNHASLLPLEDGQKIGGLK